MPKCKICGQPSRGLFFDTCWHCEYGSSLPKRSPSAADDPLSQKPSTPEILTRGSAETCVFFGVIFLLIGAYFLIVSPSVGEVINLQRLAIGHVSVIAGAIFTAAGIRPR